MALTDILIRKTKPGPRLAKLSDGGGLQLWVEASGSKRWRLAYRFSQKQKTLALGVYPRVSLAEAREAREAAKRLLASGQDPSMARKLARATEAANAASTFDVMAAELLQKKRAESKAEGRWKRPNGCLGWPAPP